MKINQLVKGGIAKGEIVVITANSNIIKPPFPTRKYNTSSKLTVTKQYATSVSIIAVLHLVIFIAKVAEWLWRLLPDKCEVDTCHKLGIRGNETRIDGILMCDYCSYLRMYEREYTD